MQDASEVSLAIRAVFEPAEEAIGVEAVASEGFDAGDDMRAKVEVLAAITARANCIAAEMIAQWEAEEDRKRELFDHYAGLKESMLNEMLEARDDEDPSRQQP